MIFLKKLDFHFLIYLKMVLKENRFLNKNILTDDLKDKILIYDYNKIKYFDSLDLDMSPYEN